MSEVPHLLSDWLQPLQQRRVSRAYRCRFFGRMHTPLLLRRAIFPELLAMSRS